jgi:hypothetical protein
VQDPSPAEVGARIDWSSWYLTDKADMGEGGEQGKEAADLFDDQAQP